MIYVTRKHPDFSGCFLVLSHDCSLAVRTDGDDLDRNLEEVLHECDIIAELLRKFLFCTAVCEVCVPSLELCIYRLDVSKRIERPLVRRLAVNDV
jgi:hypothetical protein